MGYQAVLGGERQFDLATISGWRLFKEWARGLDAEKFGEVRHLSEHGWSQELDALASQLASAPEQDESTRSIVANMMTRLAERGDAASLFVTDGLGEQEVPDDWWVEGEPVKSFNESDHPRDSSGRFAAGDGDSSSADEQQISAIAQSYIDDARQIASSEYVERRIAKFNDRMSEQHERLENTRTAVLKVEKKKSTAERAYQRKVEELDQVLDKVKSGELPESEIERVGAEVDKSLDKFLTINRQETDSAWKEIRKTVGDDGIKNVSLGKSESLTRDQIKTVEEVESRLNGSVAGVYEERIRSTLVQRIPEDADFQRAHFKGGQHGSDQPTINISGRLGMPQVVAHELGHSLEQNAQVHSLAIGFLHKRVGLEVPKPMGPGYMSSEVGRDDDFGKAFGSSNARYVGKHYKETNDTEIISMGMEKLYSDPVGLAKNDPEYFNFIVGVLDGSLL